MGLQSLADIVVSRLNVTAVMPRTTSIPCSPLVKVKSMQTGAHDYARGRTMADAKSAKAVQALVDAYQHDAVE